MEEIMTIDRISKIIEGVIENIQSNVEDVRKVSMDANYPLVAYVCEKLEEIIDYIPEINKLIEGEIEIAAINNIIGEIIDGVQNGDCGLIADLLEYEMIEFLQDWKEKIDNYLAQK